MSACLEIDHSSGTSDSGMPPPVRGLGASLVPEYHRAGIWIARRHPLGEWGACEGGPVGFFVGRRWWFFIGRRRWVFVGRRRWVFVGRRRGRIGFRVWWFGGWGGLRGKRKRLFCPTGRLQRYRSDAANEGPSSDNHRSQMHDGRMGDLP